MERFLCLLCRQSNEFAYKMLILAVVIVHYAVSNHFCFSHKSESCIHACQIIFCPPVRLRRFSSFLRSSRRIERKQFECSAEAEPSRRRGKAYNFDMTTVEEGRYVGPQHCTKTGKTCAENMQERRGAHASGFNGSPLVSHMFSAGFLDRICFRCFRSYHFLSSNLRELGAL